MTEKLKRFARRHPLLRDAALWAIPAVLLGSVLRWLLLSYQPFAYWGTDSSSYYTFVDNLLTKGDFELKEKRRYVYPLYLLGVGILPGATLKWLAWLQHGFGLLTLLPLAYVVRKSFVHWRWIVLPVTLLYVSLPMVIWFEHELLGENLFYAAFIWAMAGWAAWTSQAAIPRARLLWWWFFAAYTVILLIKPSGRFIVPGVILGLLAVRAWRTLTWKQLTPLAAVVAVAMTMGTDKQSSWLLYSSSFPLTRLDTPLHAEYKTEVRDLITDLRARLGSYFLLADEGPKVFLKYPEKHPDRPLWAALGEDDDKRARIYRDLALEGILARPDLFLFISAQKLVHSARLEEFKMERFDGDYFARRFEDGYNELAEERPQILWRLFALPKNQPPPRYEEMAPRLGKTGTKEEERLVRYLRGVQESFTLVSKRPEGFGQEWAIAAYRPAILGWLFLAGAVLALASPYRDTIGVWVVLAVGYLFGVFLVGSANPRFFAAAWPPLILAIAVPFDLLLRAISGLWQQRPSAAPNPTSAA